MFACIHAYIDTWDFFPFWRYTLAELFQQYLLIQHKQNIYN